MSAPAKPEADAAAPRGTILFARLPAYIEDRRRGTIRRAPGSCRVCGTHLMRGDGRRVRLLRRGSLGWAEDARWSPDGSRIASARGLPRLGRYAGELFTVARSGRDLRSVARWRRQDDVVGAPGSWSPDSTRLASSRYVRAQDTHWVIVANARGGGGERMFTSPLAESLGLPVWSPDGARVAAAGFRNDEDGSAESPLGIWLIDVTSGAVTNLADLPAGESRTNAAELAWSPDGRWVAVSHSTPARRARLLLVDVTNGAVRTLVVNSRRGTFFAHLRWSPNAQQIAYERETSSGARRVEILVAAVAGGPPRDLTGRTRPRRRRGSGDDFDANAGSPSWSPDGRRIAFARNGDIWTIGPNARGLRRLTRGPSLDYRPDWAPR